MTEQCENRKLTRQECLPYCSNEDQQFIIKVGKIDGDRIAFEIVPEDGAAITFDLMFTDGHIKGAAKGERHGEKMTAKVRRDARPIAPRFESVKQ